LLGLPITPDSLLPANEAARLCSLHHHLIIRPLHEPIFEEIVRSTAQVFNLPIPLITLIDAEEAIYIANQELATTPRGGALH
jgi:hypothetical protein